MNSIIIENAPIKQEGLLQDFEIGDIIKLISDNSYYIVTKVGILENKAVDGYIEQASLKGYRHIFQPSKTNPNGDSLVYLVGDENLIKDRIIDHYKNQGFKVVDYQYGGIKIEW